MTAPSRAPRRAASLLTQAPRMVDEGGAQDPAERVDRGFTDAVRALEPARRRASPDAQLRPGCGLTGARALELFDAQVTSRHLDFAARRLRAAGAGYYTIGSSGHEGNAAVAAALRPTDPALLHYRSGAFFVERARQAGYPHAVRDVLLGIVASREEPISGGRHKVFGSRALQVLPQTSTIASHLPKAMGMAHALGMRSRLGLPLEVPEDAIVVCSFGDASTHHSTALGAIHAAAALAYQRLPVPLLLVCEDNGLGISVPTPPGWIESCFSGRPGLQYVKADGCDLAAAFDAAAEAVARVRRTRAPLFLHLEVVRLMGHAGSDVELSYRSMGQIRATEARDPLLASARLLVGAGVATPDEILERYERERQSVGAAADEAARRPRLEGRSDVMAPLATHRPDAAADEAIAREVQRPADENARARLWAGRLPEHEPAAPLAAQLNRALGDLLAKYPEVLVFGEDVARKGGVYGVTRGLHRRAGPLRVFDAVLDEQSILGFAIGAAHVGFLPVPEIQYLAYLHNAEDQVRGEAASTRFFSQGAYESPMVLRIAAYAYQEGFGGHFHNDNAVAVLRDIPGVVIASPSRGDDAVAMLRTCVAAARTEGAVCIFLEPIALYGRRDLYEAGDGGWMTPYDPAGPHVSIGSARAWGDGEDLLLVSFANGVPMSLRVARRLARGGVRCGVLDLRWLAPLPKEDLLAAAGRTGRVLVVDETRRSGGASEGVITALVEGGYRGQVVRVASEDSFVPLGPAAQHVLVGEPDIERAARELLARR